MFGETVYIDKMLWLAGFCALLVSSTPICEKRRLRVREGEASIKLFRVTTLGSTPKLFSRKLFLVVWLTPADLQIDFETLFYKRIQAMLISVLSSKYIASISQNLWPVEDNRLKEALVLPHQIP
jgi:hypothetical protein